MPFSEYEDFADCVAKNKGKVEDPEAYCAQIKRSIEGDAKQRRIGFDRYTLEDKIIEETDEYLTMPAIIASEIVHQYEDGWAYKPADELEKMAKIANRIGNVPVKILEHPGADTNYLLLKQGDTHGRAGNFRFVKNLIDEKTKRPMRRGVKADITWYKDMVSADVLERVKNGDLRDNSIGFTFDYDDAEGDFNGVHYDYIQRNIFLNHIAAPIEAGRCPGPICGIGYDSATMIRFDAAVMDTCPVCKRIKEVGFAVAGKRLWKQYGADVLEVIEGNPLPQLEPAQSNDSADLTKAFNVAIKQLKANIKT